MRFAPAVYLASGAVAAVVSQQEKPNCILVNRREMAADAICGNFDVLKSCFDKFTNVYVEDMTECYQKAGCEADLALKLAEGAGARCQQLFESTKELRKRTRGELDARGPKVTQAAMLARGDGFSDPNAHLFPRSAMSGDECLTVKTTSTETCKDTTVNGKSTSTDCSSIQTTTSVCKGGLTCSRDSQGQNVCMQLHDSLDVAGVIVAIVMAVGAVAGIVTITYLCVQNKKEQKRLTAKAEATALARAATKKKRAAERAPLMNQAGASGPPGGGDPFADRNRS